MFFYYILVIYTDIYWKMNSLKVQYVIILIENFQKSTKIINKMWINYSFDIMMLVHCVGEISTEVSVLTS